MYDVALVRDTTHTPLAEPFGPDLVLALCYDLPTKVSTTPAEHLDRWGVSWQTVRHIALQNLAMDDFDREIIEVGETTYTQLIGDSYFVCGQLALLDRAPGKNWLVSTPSRHSAMLHQIKDKSTLHVMTHMAFATMSLYDTHPGAVSPNLYLVQPDRIDPIHLGIEQDGRLAIAPGEGVLEFLSQLADPDA